MSNILHVEHVEEYLAVVLNKLIDHSPEVVLDRTMNSADYMTEFSNLELKISTSKHNVAMWLELEGTTQIYVTYTEEHAEPSKCTLQVTETGTRLLDNRSAERVGAIASNIFNTLRFITDKQSTHAVLAQMAVLNDYKGGA